MTLNDNQVLYYGVYIPSDCNGANDIQGDERVFTNKQEALALMKKFKGRLKTFVDKEEALDFACSGEDVVDKAHFNGGNNSNLVGEKPSLFRGPKSQDLVVFRKAIENGAISVIRDLIWSNPRYLISSGDTPTVLQEGSRYNGLHVACKAKKPEICELILDTISNAAFLEILYPDDTAIIREDRVLFLLDLYLNMPDKALNETPLHFASKYGCAGCVELLVNYPQCNRHRRNKYDQTPRDMVCSRVSEPNPDLIAHIEVLLGDRYFVPVLRSEDWSVQPSIGEPWSPDIIKEPILTDLNSTPKSSALRVMAYAGPMSPSDADRFYKQCKTPPSRNLTPQRCATPRSGTFKAVLKSEAKLLDSEKGLETVGRSVAKDMGIKWHEYWPFLDSFCDIASEEGLTKLEAYLRHKLKSLTRMPSLDEVTKKLDLLMCHDEDSMPVEPSGQIPTSPISELCIKLSSLHLEGTPQGVMKESSASCGDVTEGLKESSRNIIAEQHTLIADKMLTKIEKLSGGFDDEEACDVLENVLLTEFRGCQSFASHNELARMLFNTLQASYDVSELGKRLAGWLHRKGTDEHLANTYTCCVMRTIASLCTGGQIDAYGCRHDLLQPEDRKLQRRLFHEDGDVFLTPETSPDTSPEAVTPDEIENIYITGSHLTKTDIDVWRALEDVPVDSGRFPVISIWKQAMLQSKEELQRLETPRSNRLKSQTPVRRDLLATPTGRISSSNSPVSPLPPLLKGLSNSNPRGSLLRKRLQL